MRLFTFILAGAFSFLAGCATVDDADARNSGAQHSSHNEAFSKWLHKISKEAVVEGIRPETVDAAFDGITLQEKVLKLDSKQPEKTIKFPEYRERIVTDKRINSGVEEWDNHGQEIESASRNYGVPPQYILALWGIETSYGKITGDYYLVEALATLAFEGRRKEFFTKELMNALKMIDRGMVEISEFKGSWAGAMGHCQFMPSSYLKYAVDGDMDGHSDIWGDYSDIFASIANYLHTEGWDDSVEWGMEVNLPSGFSNSLMGREIKKTAAEWQSLGVTPAGNVAMPQNHHAYAIVRPDGSDAVYMVSRNYDVIMKWNRSLYFATSVGMLADAIKESR